ncbi:hypothetical protein CYMTET_16017 [Cymbomonas tetramitiformis]|uniref:Uncharacterized protein n=1 Tax=Cymbomonas tetramitiformis TaxID=36881 RepID=A0AAE0GDA2_9CHLO|nr:hypothetical protein CYMTET_16017 [Cymbomonas tetramitiformis]
MLSFEADTQWQGVGPWPLHVGRGARCGAIVDVKGCYSAAEAGAGTQVVRVTSSEAEPGRWKLSLTPPRSGRQGYVSPLLEAGVRGTFHPSSKRASGYVSPLLEAGVRDAKEVNAPQLAMLQPTQIYSSPYLRVLQTLEPFLIQDRANLNNTGRVKVEYSLYEHNDQDYSDKSHNLHPAKTVPDAWHQRFHIDSSYGSYLAPEELVEYNSTQEKVHFRVKRFVKHLLEEYHGTSEVILLVSHQNIVHSLLHQTTDKPMEDFGVQMGELVEVDWTKL